MIFRLVERIKRRGKPHLAYSLLRSHIRNRWYPRSTQKTIRDYLIDLAIEFGQQGDDASLDELEWAMRNSGQTETVDIARRWCNEIVKDDLHYAPRFLLCLKNMIRLDFFSRFPTLPATHIDRLLELADDVLKLNKSTEIVGTWKKIHRLALEIQHRRKVSL
jgi:hypothetical protein